MIKDVFYGLVDVGLETYKHGPVTTEDEFKVVEKWYEKSPYDGHRGAVAEIMGMRQNLKE